jgi:hypothetical protein
MLLLLLLARIRGKTSFVHPVLTTQLLLLLYNRLLGLALSSFSSLH